MIGVSGFAVSAAECAIGFGADFTALFVAGSQDAADADEGGYGFDRNHQAGISHGEADIFLCFEQIEKIPLTIQ